MRTCTHWHCPRRGDDFLSSRWGVKFRTIRRGDIASASLFLVCMGLSARDNMCTFIHFFIHTYQSVYGYTYTYIYTCMQVWKYVYVCKFVKSCEIYGVNSRLKTGVSIPLVPPIGVWRYIGYLKLQVSFCKREGTKWLRCPDTLLPPTGWWQDGEDTLDILSCRSLSAKERVQSGSGVPIYCGLPQDGDDILDVFSCWSLSAKERLQGGADPYDALSSSVIILKRAQ